MMDFERARLAIGSGRHTAEMEAELTRLEHAVTEAVDFDHPPDDHAREVDERINAVWNFDIPEVGSVLQIRLSPEPSLDAAACDAVIYTPKAPTRGVIFFIHGGGWAFCNLRTHERFMRVLCNAAGKTLVGVHYRLAPEHPYPAALNDVVSAFRSVLASRDSLGLPEGPIVVAGDSAGGNLALALMFHEMAAGRELPAGGLLFYGVFGRDFTTPSYRQYPDGELLTEAVMRRLWAWYDPSELAKDDPLAVPLLASDEQLSRLPPLFLLAAEMDPLASDTIKLKTRLDELGRSDILLVEPGVVHGYLQMTATLEAARRSTAAAADAAREFIDADLSG
jgi:acetyl esterase